MKHGCRCYAFEGVNWRRVAVILGFFVGVIFAMALVQLWIESQEVEGENCKLFDTGQFIIGKTALNFMSRSFFASIADIWVVVSIAGFFVWLILDFSHREREFGRFFLVWGLIYLQRAFTIGATRYPLLGANEAYLPTNPILGALLITIGAMRTYSDFMFSGHTATWTITALFIFRYAHHRFLAWLYIAFNFVGPFLLVTVEEHYLADVLVGFLVGWWTFSGYHQLNDEKLLAPLRGAVTIYLHEEQENEALRLVFPLTVTDAEGNILEIQGDKKNQVQVIGAETNPPRRALWRMIKWLDGDTRMKPTIRFLGEGIGNPVKARMTVKYDNKSSNSRL